MHQIAQKIKQSTDSPRTQRIVERIFSRFTTGYGRKFADLWAGTDLEAVKIRWAEAITDYGMDEITRGVAACDTREWPPTLPEFLLLCRPPIDAESAFYEAVTQMQRRSTHTDTWSHPAVFWAASTIGTHDLAYGTWISLGARWRKIFAAQLAAGEWQAIPERLVSLPPPPKGRSMEAEEKLRAHIETVLSPKYDHKKWAKNHKANYLAGGAAPFSSISAAAEALGETVDAWNLLKLNTKCID